MRVRTSNIEHCKWACASLASGRGGHIPSQSKSWITCGPLAGKQRRQQMRNAATSAAASALLLCVDDQYVEGIVRPRLTYGDIAFKLARCTTVVAGRATGALPSPVPPWRRCWDVLPADLSAAAYAALRIAAQLSTIQACKRGTVCGLVRPLLRWQRTPWQRAALAGPV